MWRCIYCALKQSSQERSRPEARSSRSLESGVEGLVHISSLEDDTYEFDGAITLVGSFGGKRYRVGQRLRVMAVRADVSAGQVGFTVNLPPETV